MVLIFLMNGHEPRSHFGSVGWWRSVAGSLYDGRPGSRELVRAKGRLIFKGSSSNVLLLARTYLLKVLQPSKQHSELEEHPHHEPMGIEHHTMSLWTLSSHNMSPWALSTHTVIWPMPWFKNTPTKQVQARDCWAPITVIWACYNCSNRKWNHVITRKSQGYPSSSLHENLYSVPFMV